MVCPTTKFKYEYEDEVRVLVPGTILYFLCRPFSKQRSFPSSFSWAVTSYEPKFVLVVLVHVWLVLPENFAFNSTTSTVAYASMLCGGTPGKVL